MPIFYPNYHWSGKMLLERVKIDVCVELKYLNLAKFLANNIILSNILFYIFRECMEWPQQLYESGMNIEIVATASMASYGILKRLEWVATIWLQPILEDGICMFSTNTISIREFYKKETEIRSTSNTNPRYLVHSWTTGNTMGYFLPKSVIF